MKKVFASCLALIMLASPAWLQAQELGWRYIEANFSDVDAEDISNTGVDADGDGWNVEAVFGFGAIFLYAEGSDLTAELDNAGAAADIDVERRGYGLGFQKTGDNSAGYIKLGRQSFEFQPDTPNAQTLKESGFAVELGLRHRFTEKWEGHARVEVINASLSTTPGGRDSSTAEGIGVGFLYHINNRFALGLDYEMLEDFDTIEAGIRFSFGAAGGEEDE